MPRALHTVWWFGLEVESIIYVNIAPRPGMSCCGKNNFWLRAIMMLKRSKLVALPACHMSTNFMPNGWGVVTKSRFLEINTLSYHYVIVRILDPRKYKNGDFCNMWKKNLIEFCGVIEHCISYFPMQLERYSTFLQDLIFLQACIFVPPKNVHLSLPAPKMQIFNFLNMWKKFSLKIGATV